MKKDIHPKYEEITASCSCGNVMKIRSTDGHFLLQGIQKYSPFFVGFSQGKTGKNSMFFCPFRGIIKNQAI